jgi:hypothetical protein
MLGSASRVEVPSAAMGAVMWLLSDVGFSPRLVRAMSSPLAAPVESSHKGRTSKLRVEFKYKRIAEDEWQIEAHYPGAEIRHIKGFKTKAEADEWLQGTGALIG